MSETAQAMFTVFQVMMLIDGFFMWSLIGQGVLALLAGQQRHGNVIYRFLGQITRPVIAATRLIIPRIVSDRHLGALAVVLLVLIRFVLYIIWYANGWIPHGIGTPMGE
jgi:uncharacterized protein YggT (Ycf19 family)